MSRMWFYGLIDNFFIRIKILELKYKRYLCVGNVYFCCYESNEYNCMFVCGVCLDAFRCL